MCLFNFDVNAADVPGHAAPGMEQNGPPKQAAFTLNLSRGLHSQQLQQQKLSSEANKWQALSDSEAEPGSGDSFSSGDLQQSDSDADVGDEQESQPAPPPLKKRSSKVRKGISCGPTCHSTLRSSSPHAQSNNVRHDKNNDELTD